MSSARLPEHGAVPPPAETPGPAPAPDCTPAGLFLAPTPGPHTAHLVPCSACRALNGRSALTCWSCEADLLALAPVAQAVPAPAVALPIVELVVEPEPAAPAASAEASHGRRGLRLVSRSSAAVPVQDAPPLAAPEPMLDLPVLTEQVEDAAPMPPAQKAWHHDRAMIALVLAAVALLAAAAGLRWLAPPPEPVAGIPSAPATPRADAAVEPSLGLPAQGGEPERAGLSFAPVEVAPAAATAEPPAAPAARSRALPPARVVTAAPRPVPKPREIRETVSPPPAACTSNMAALGFCTLPPATAKE
ncbi:MAG: hypothetical protein Q8R33_10450 [Burkholderiales bacterium]|nr:hypothetical protein [Burkholderiales bacterium]